MTGGVPSGEKQNGVAPAASLRDAAAAQPGFRAIPGSADTPPPGYAGRRISLTAWGLAGVAGIGLWILIFKLI